MSRLSEAVKERIHEVAKGEASNATELLRAEQLSEQYAEVTPETYILPLNAMAGFTSAAQGSPTVEEALEITALLGA